MTKPEVVLPDIPRCEAFWRRENTDRPLVSAWVGSYEIPQLYSRGLAQLPEGIVDPTHIDLERFRPDYEKLFRDHSKVDVDVPWAALPPIGVPWVEAILGCPVHHKGGNFRAGHWLDTYDRIDEMEIRHDWLEKLIECTQWLIGLSGGRFPVALCLMRGPADLLAAIRGAEQSIYDLIDRPEQVERTLQVLTDTWIQVSHAQINCIPSFAGGYCFSIQNLWSREPGGWFQDDAIAYWSPSYYRKFIVPCETKLSECMPSTGIHLHPASLFTIEDLVKMPALDAIEVNLDDVGPRIPAMMPKFRQVLAHKPLLIWGAFSEEDMLAIRQNLPAAGLALQIMGETPEQVQKMIQFTKEIWER